ncbi:class I SAM-dependent methyltransferase [Dysgonomonas sp. 521]|uniref:class I SAM-dependent methyltransferase n=1 Tax=Dysgonomonas sp. 521 TaxID=2302932 RepID=UPI0013D626A1|nr:class I SAM-dependent methyltransferase [Dysgonomonas sp. 521]NDV96068.1 class I SAM-dependent methyltransferase [Dysgonomonas sp. 521]
MKENKYEDNTFFDQYSQMARSIQGLKGAGEWHVLKKMLPDFKGKQVLDLGCGFGWHCRYAADKGAKSVLGIDISEKMINEAKKKNNSPCIKYECVAIEDFDYPPLTFDIVISSLAFHYAESFDDICQKVHRTLAADGKFVFSVEHPVFTAFGNQDWFYAQDGSPLHWPVDNYFREGKRNANFLGENVIKYHKTLTTYINGLLSSGFNIQELREPEPDNAMLRTMPEMRDELRRPIFLIISAGKR